MTKEQIDLLCKNKGVEGLAIFNSKGKILESRLKITGASRGVVVDAASKLTARPASGCGNRKGLLMRNEEDIFLFTVLSDCVVVSQLLDESVANEVDSRIRSILSEVNNSAVGAVKQMCPQKGSVEMIQPASFVGIEMDSLSPSSSSVAAKSQAMNNQVASVNSDTGEIPMVLNIEDIETVEEGRLVLIPFILVGVAAAVAAVLFIMKPSGHILEEGGADEVIGLMSYSESESDFVFSEDIEDEIPIGSAVPKVASIGDTSESVDAYVLSMENELIAAEEVSEISLSQMTKSKLSNTNKLMSEDDLSNQLTVERVKTENSDIDSIHTESMAKSR